MFTGIVTDIGRIERLEDRGDLRARIRCAFAPASIARRRLDRLRRRLPDRGRPRPGGRGRLVRRRRLRRDPGAHQHPRRPHRLGGRRAASTSSGRSGSGTSSAATSSRATSTALAEVLAVARRGRQHPRHLPRPGRARPLHRPQGLGRAQRHLADRQRGRRRALRRQHHPAHPQPTPPGAACSRGISSTSRSTPSRATWPGSPTTRRPEPGHATGTGAARAAVQTLGTPWQEDPEVDRIDLVPAALQRLVDPLGLETDVADDVRRKPRDGARSRGAPRRRRSQARHPARRMSSEIVPRGLLAEPPEKSIAAIANLLSTRFRTFGPVQVRLEPVQS